MKRRPWLDCVHVQKHVLARSAWTMLLLVEQVAFDGVGQWQSVNFMQPVLA